MSDVSTEGLGIVLVVAHPRDSRRVAGRRGRAEGVDRRAVGTTPDLVEDLLVCLEPLDAGDVDEVGFVDLDGVNQGAAL